MTTTATGRFDVTAGPAKSLAHPGQTVVQHVWNYGTMPETISIGVDEIGHVQSANGQCGFTHAAPLATTDTKSVHLNPGQEGTVHVSVAKTGPAGYHAVTVAYSVAGTGNVKVSEGVATVLGVTYAGNAGTTSASSPCVAVAQTPTSSGPNVGVAAGGAGVLVSAALLLTLAVRSVKRRRRRVGRHAKVPAVS